MSNNRPYLIRATYDWIVDNQLTPYLLVNAEFPGVQLPMDYVNAGRIVLNIAPKACRGLHLGNEAIVFSARFSGESMQVSFNPLAVLAVYAKENGRGMEFELIEEGGEPPPAASLGAGSSAEKRASRPSLKLIK